MSYETPWRSLGETARNFRNADKSEGNCITCTLSDTTCVYHRPDLLTNFPFGLQSLLFGFFPAEGKVTAKRSAITPDQCPLYPRKRTLVDTLATSVAGLRLSSSKRASTRSGMSKPSVNQP